MQQGGDLNVAHRQCVGRLLLLDLAKLLHPCDRCQAHRPLQAVQVDALVVASLTGLQWPDTPMLAGAVGNGTRSSVDQQTSTYLVAAGVWC